MNKKRGILIFLAVMIFFVPRTSADDRLDLKGTDRVLIISPHPDDETLAVGGIIMECVSRKIPVKIVFLTYGDNNELSFMLYRKHPVFVPKAVEAMGMVRAEESKRADELLGLEEKDLIFLGYPDFGTLDIWYYHWAERPPDAGMLTQAKKVPYKNSFRPGALFKGEEILKDIKTITEEFSPTKIFVSHPADNNPDHVAAYLFLRVALLDLEGKVNAEVFPYLVHYKNWPVPKKYSPDSLMTPPTELAGEFVWNEYRLSPEGVSKKYEAIKKYKTQVYVRKLFMYSFARKSEGFGDFPDIIIEEEKVSFLVFKESERSGKTGMGEQYISKDGKDIVLTVVLSRGLGKTAGIYAHLFGYKKDTPFEKMPKLHLGVGAMSERISDQRKALLREKIKVTRKNDKIEIRVPLQELGDPSELLMNVQIYLGEFRVDRGAWRMVKLKHKGEKSER